MNPPAYEGASAPSTATIVDYRTYVAQRLEAAEKSALCTCGMQPFNANHSFHGVFVTREGLLCSYPMEVDYTPHNNQKASSYQPELFTYCAGVDGNGYIDEEFSV